MAGFRTRSAGRLMPPTDGADSRTEFRYIVVRPDPNATKLSQRKQGMVRAFASDGVEAGFVTFGLGLGEGRVSVTMVETSESYKRRGCATAMVQVLEAAYPESGRPNRQRRPTTSPHSQDMAFLICRRGCQGVCQRGSSFTPVLPNPTES